jgi:POT family proton-dependent oligopeptide transporter
VSKPGELLGHPKGLFVLFFTEMWERFSFYSMRGVMTLYMTNVVLVAMAAAQGAEAAGGFADQVYGAYLGFVYSATFVGGMLADRLLGQRLAIYIGGVLMSLAHFSLTTHALLVTSAYQPGELNFLFYVGLGLLCCGNGFFKPNISTIVGTLYTQEDARRDGAFTIFYMGINIGATLSSFSSGIAQAWGWYLAYLLAGIGMIVSLATLFAGGGLLEGRGMPPAGARLLGRGRLGMPNIVPLFVGVAAFVPAVAYMLAHPTHVQSLAQWLGVLVLFYLLWEAARAEHAGQDQQPTHLAALLGGVCGLLALTCLMISSNGAAQPDGTLLARLSPWMSRAAIGLLAAACAGLLYLVLRASQTREGGRMFVVILLCAFSMVFWGFFELQGSTIIRFADAHVTMWMLGWQIPTAFFANFVNPFLIILLGLPFASLWVVLDRRQMEPSTPLKFALGLLQLGLGFAALWLAAWYVQQGWLTF